jgi:hypothetical protein
MRVSTEPLCRGERHRSHHRIAWQCGEHRSDYGVCLRCVFGSPVGTPGAVAERPRLKASGIDEVICIVPNTLGPFGMVRRYRSSGPPHVISVRPGPHGKGSIPICACRHLGDGQNVSGRANLDGSTGVHEGFQQLFSFTTRDWTQRTTTRAMLLHLAVLFLADREQFLLIDTPEHSLTSPTRSRHYEPVMPSESYRLVNLAPRQDTIWGRSELCPLKRPGGRG